MSIDLLGAIVSFSIETVAFYRTEGQQSWERKLGIRIRCHQCHGDLQFEKFLIANLLGKQEGQITCGEKKCMKPISEKSRLCQMHFLKWTPGDLATNLVETDIGKSVHWGL